jgi:trehalose-phosphatase
LKQKGAVARVGALFTDYDGTISPINVPRSESRVPPEIISVLNRIGERIPVAVITTKSLEFVVTRTPFACAWSALGGLETRIGRTTTRASCLKTTRHLETALRYAKSMSEGLFSVEEKRDSREEVVAFSVDWRFADNLDKAKDVATRVFSFYETLPVVTVRHEGQPFFDVFPCAVNKGRALLDLKQKLRVQDNVMYMGDSAVDNPAFEAADVAVGVMHAETPIDLACGYFVKFDEVAEFLRHLLENSFCFDPSFPMIFRKTVDS